MNPRQLVSSWLRRLQARPSARRPNRRTLAGLESLEERVVPSTINWVNRGQASDNFAAVFGSSAATVRAVIDRAINEWQNVISNFNQVNHGDNNHIDVTISMNTAAGSSGGSTSVTSTDANGKPLSATVSLGRTGDGTHAWFLDPTLFSSAFLGTPTNAFAGYTQPGSAAAGGLDLLEVVTHELGHACGFSSNARVNAHCTDTHVADTTSSDGHHGDYWAFVGTGGFHCLLTGFNAGPNGGSDSHGGEHFAAPGASATVGGTTYYGADDLMTPYYTSSQRRIISRNDAFVLRDSYGYTVNDPATTLGTFYVVLNPATGNLILRGRQDAASADGLTVDTFTVLGLNFVSTSVSLGTPVPGTDYTSAYTASFVAAAVHSIELDTWTGLFSDVYLMRTPNVPITVNNVGSTFVTLGTGGNVQGVLGSLTLNSPTGLIVDDSADTGNHTIVFSDSGGTTFGQITGLLPGTSTITYRNSSITTGIDLKTGTGTEIVNVNASPNGVLSLEGHSNNTTVNVGNGTTQNIRSGVIITNPPDFTALNVDDSGDSGTRTAVVRTWSFDATYGEINGLAANNASIFYKYNDTSGVTVKTGTGTNVVNVLDTVRPVTVVSNDSTVNVQATTSPLTVQSVGGFQTTTVNVGNAGSLRGINGAINITTSPLAFTTLNVDGSAETASQTVTLSPGSVAGMSALITYQLARLNSVTVRAGSGVNVITVTDTALVNTPTTVSTGGNGSTVNVRATTGPLTVNAQGVADAVNIGNGGRVNGIQGAVTVLGTGAAVLTADDSADPNSYGAAGIILDTYTPAGDTLYESVTGLARAAINYRASGVSNVIVRGGTGLTIFQVNSTPTGVRTDLYGNSNYNGFIAYADRSAGLNGPVGMHGNPNTATTVNFAEYYDYTSPGGQTYTLTANTTGRAGAAPVTYDHQSEMILYASHAGGNTVNVLSNAAGVFANLAVAAGDQLNIGSTAPTLGGSLAPILGSVGVVGTAVSVTVDDSGNTSPTARDVTFRQDAYGFINMLGLTDDPQGDILYNLDAASSVTVLGGAGNTTYHLQDFLAAVPLTLNPGGGTNTLDYSAATGNVYVNLQTGVATDLAGFANIRNVVGASGGPAGSYNILVGNGGNVLTGGTGRSNLLIAGGSASTLVGGDSGDILIAGYTDYDTDAASLQAIVAYWTGPDDYATRVANLESGAGVPLLNAPATVHGNGGGNTVTSNGTMDLIFANLGVNPDTLS